MLARVVFSVDNTCDLNKYSKAIHHLDVLRVTKMRGDVTMCVGSYQGAIEPSFMVLERDWDECVKDGMSSFIKDQESVLHVPGDVRQPCTLRTVGGTFIASVGEMVEIGGDIDEYDSGWTYVIETDSYYRCGEDDSDSYDEEKDDGMGGYSASAWAAAFD